MSVGSRISPSKATGRTVASEPFGEIVKDPSEIDVTVRRICRCLITPEQASLWLGINLGNRRLRRMLVGFLAREITNGEWQSDHPNPIVFSDAGRLIDGQHRLMAIVQAKIPVVARVEFGARDETRGYIDTGISRLLEDRHQFLEDLHHNSIAARMIGVWWFHANGMKSRCSIEEAKELFATHREAITWISECGRKVPRVTVAAVMLAIAQFYERAGRDKASEFLQSLCDPDGAVQPARRLREYLIAMSGHSSRDMNQERYQKTIAACKAFEAGKEVVVLRCANW